ncbi:MAG: hypothetical protein HY298_14365 [Verrucomicrobia bacterium]|nr:hypothetical protein [Verrucomicrobiota bacterium]
MRITLGLKIISRLVLTTAFALPFAVKAQSDNFDDGDDTANPTWTHQDPIGDSLGVPNGSWTFPGTNTYRLQASASPDPLALGAGRIASTLTNVYSDFYAAVDVVDWDDTLHQAFGILARLENIGPGTTTGYAFTYQANDHRLSISGITNEAATDLPGTSIPITLDKTNAYRFVFAGTGTNFQGRVYQLPDTVNPLVLVQGADSAYASGIGGLIVYDNSVGGNATADATFDNYLAAMSEPGSPPPVIVSIHNLANNGLAANTVGVRFDQAVTLPSATNHSNYLVNAGTVNVADVHLRPDGRSVEVVTTAPVGEFFSVCTVNVQGVAGNSAPTIATGYTSEYSGLSIGTPGDPVAAGQVYTSFWDTFDVTVGGSGFGMGLDDHFHFLQQVMTRDFDVRVRVTSLDMADFASQAGLMARESLDANSASIQTYFTPTGGLNQIQATVRPVAGTDAIDFLTSPPVPAGAASWLRLSRSNNVFTAYYATNGTDWIISGVTTQGFATNLYVGMAVSAHSVVTNTTASFTDFYPQGGRPGDEIHPGLSASLNGTNISFKWPQTPRSYAVEVATSLSESNDWGLLVVPVGFDLSNRVFQVSLPVGFLGQQLFVRNTRVDKLIPDIPAIMTTAGIILSPGAGLRSSTAPGTLCAVGVKSGTAYIQTNFFLVFTNPTSASSIDTLQSSSSTGSSLLDTVLRVINVTTNVTLGLTNCNDNLSATEARSQVIPLPLPYTNSTRIAFVVAAKTNSAFNTVIKVQLHP